MKNKKTYYHLILDRSGSMNLCIEQTVDGVNSQIRRIKEVAANFPEQELLTSLTLFNNKITKVWNRLKPEQLRDLTFSDYKPAGTTALNDAIGETIQNLQKTVGIELEADEASVVVVIITDGYENSSVSWSHEQIASLINKLESTEKWSFSYIGATIDAVEIATGFNIKKVNSMHFNVSDSFVLYNKLGNSIESYLKSKGEGEIRTDFLDNSENL
jgi:hypothetical protein